MSYARGTYILFTVHFHVNINMQFWI